jgi:orotate phosphoribosyltransferase
VTREELARRVSERALLHGDFVLRSGKRSTVYLDKYRFETDPALLGPIGAALAELAAEGAPPARLAGPELGAVPLAAATALASGIPFLIVRKASSRASSSPASGCSRSRTSSPPAVL